MGTIGEQRRDKDDAIISNDVEKLGAQGQNSSKERPSYVDKTPKDTPQSKPESPNSDSMQCERHSSDVKTSSEKSEENLLDASVRNVADEQSKNLQQTKEVFEKTPNSVQLNVAGEQSGKTEDTK